MPVKSNVAESNDKGSLLEDIVTKIHAMTGLRATPRVKLPSRFDPSREREIDVLLEAHIGPYPYQIPIECKNWGEPVGIGDIDAYEGKLSDLGLNLRGAIYVSAGGYESGAASKAQSLGIVLLEIEGLSQDRLAQELFVAVTGTLFVFPSVSEVKFQSAHATAQPSFFDSDGQFGGTVMDLLWKAWIEHSSLQLGELRGSEPVPSGWGSYVEGDFAPIEKVDYILLKEGHLLLRKGTAKKTILRTHTEGRTVLAQVETEYDSPFGRFELQRVLSEAELSEAVNRDSPIVSSIWRVKVPRVMYDGPLGRAPWLPDDELLRQLFGIHQIDPKGFVSGGSEHQLDLDTDIHALIETPSESYLSCLRERMGSSWSPKLWTVFD